jgi:hypothetical protein
MENLIGPMDLDLMDNFIKIIFMDMELIIGLMIGNISVNGEIIKCMEKEFSHGVMAESKLFFNN